MPLPARSVGRWGHALQRPVVTTTRIELTDFFALALGLVSTKRIDRDRDPGGELCPSSPKPSCVWPGKRRRETSVLAHDCTPHHCLFATLDL